MAFNKLKGLVGDVKNTANKYLNQENLDKIMGEVKDAAMDVKNSVTEYMDQTPDQRAIAKMHREKEAHLKRAPSILAIDFRSDAAGCKFYIDNNYDEPYNQSQWLKLYEKLSAEESSQALAPMYNAVVVNEDGYFVRRGLEPLSARYIAFAPGENDEVTHTYAYEPYTYKKNPRPVKRPQAAQYHTPVQTVRTTQNQPAASKPLNAWEQSQLTMAKRRYNEAVDRLKRKPNDANCIAEEKKAHAEYMAMMAQYAGRM